MMVRKRNPRVDQAVRDAVADILESQVSDPRLSLVTVTEVDVAPDQAHAVVYYTTVNPELITDDVRSRGQSDPVPDPDEVAAGLASAAARIRSLLGDRLRLRRTPELDFRADPVEAHASRIEGLLRELRDTEVPDGD